jgi:enoyl-CoA hydratase/carnithine racemase
MNPRFEQVCPEIGVLYLDRPERSNAFDDVAFARLGNDLEEIGFLPLRALILTGRGAHFSSGMDLKPDNLLLAEALDASQNTDQARALIRRLKAYFAPLRALPFPTIAAIEGVCLGAGLELALHCDLRVAAENASFSLPETRIGLAPDLGGLTLLRRLVGPGPTALLALSGRRLNATQAYSLGLLSELVAPGQAFSAALTLARDISLGAPTATREVLRHLRHADDPTTADQLELETEAGLAALTSGELVEAAIARAERRDPSWAAQLPQ